MSKDKVVSEEDVRSIVELIVHSLNGCVVSFDICPRPDCVHARNVLDAIFVLGKAVEQLNSSLIIPTVEKNR